MYPKTSVDFESWVNGDLNSFVNSITSVQHVVDHTHMLKDPNNPAKKMDFLRRIHAKFSDNIPNDIWIRLITQDDNIEIFTYFYQQVAGLEEESSKLSFIQMLCFHPACCWAFYAINANIYSNPNLNRNNFKIFQCAIRYCIDGEVPAYSRIKRIWNVPVAYKFYVLNKIACSITNSNFKKLYTVNDVTMILPYYDILDVNMYSIVDVIMDHLDTIRWQTKHQVQLLTQLSSIVTSDTRIYQIINTTMSRFIASGAQRKIWLSLPDNCIIYYEDLDWYSIDIQVVPCHRKINDKLFNLLIDRGCVYDYGNRITNYCNNQPCEILKRALESGLISLDNDQIWTNKSMAHLTEIVNYWLELLGNNRISDNVINATHIIASLINKPQMNQMKVQILNQVDLLIPRFPGSHKIYIELLRDPIPEDFEPSDDLQQHVFRHIPMLISTSLYTKYSREIAKSIIDNRISISKPDLARLILDDIIQQRLPLNSLLFNLIPIYIWESIPYTRVEFATLFSYIRGVLDNGIFTTDNHKITKLEQWINPSIVACLSYRYNKLFSDQSPIYLPNKLNYIQFICVYRDLSEITPLIDYILSHKPFELHIEMLSRDYLNLYQIYQHYTHHNMVHMLNLSKYVLIDIITQDTNSKMANSLFFSKYSGHYRLETYILRTMTSETLQLHCDMGMLQLTSNQKYILTPYQRSQLISDNEIDEINEIDSDSTSYDGSDLNEQ